MRLALKCHPDTPCDVVTRIDAEVARVSYGLKLRYLVTGKIGDLQVPRITEPKRSDGLWMHTCFEAFLRAGDAPGYLEFNLAPSTQWAAYSFRTYREGMQAPEVPAPVIVPDIGPDHLGLDAWLAPVALTELPDCTPWRAAISAVIEEVSGRRSYWALAHPAGKPDFHSPEGFVCELSPTETT